MLVAVVVLVMAVLLHRLLAKVGVVVGLLVTLMAHRGMAHHLVVEQMQLFLAVNMLALVIITQVAAALAVMWFQVPVVQVL
jgi:hypothetical protein